MIAMSYERAQLPGPHYAPMMQYRFPQMVSQGPAFGMRPTSKACGPGQGNMGCGPGCTGCRGASDLPVQLVSGLGGLPGLALARFGNTPEEDRAILRNSLIGYVVLGSIAAIFAGYHGYKRNRGNVGSAIGWGFFGFTLPILTGAVALAQGYGEPKRG